MMISNLKLKLIMLCHPKYVLADDNYCDCSCLKGCSLVTSKTNRYNKSTYCNSDNGQEIYSVPIYAKICSDTKVKYFRYKTEHYDLANDIYQLVASGKRKILEKGK